MTQAFHENAIFPETVTVCGKKLLALTLGQVALLDIADSPFLSGDEVTPADLVFSVWVCCQPYRNLRKCYANPKPTRSRVRLKGDFEEQAVIFAAFLARELQNPELWDNDGATQQERVPFWASLHQATADKMGVRHAWDVPLTEALSREWARAAADGSKVLKSQQEVDAEKSLLANYEKSKREENGQS